MYTFFYSPSSSIIKLMIICFAIHFLTVANNLVLVTFATKTSKGHERNKTGEKTFACKICDKKFIMKKSLSNVAFETKHLWIMQQLIHILTHHWRNSLTKRTLFDIISGTGTIACLPGFIGDEYCDDDNNQESCNYGGFFLWFFPGLLTLSSYFCPKFMIHWYL